MHTSTRLALTQRQDARVARVKPEVGASQLLPDARARSQASLVGVISLAAIWGDSIPNRCDRTLPSRSASINGVLSRQQPLGGLARCEERPRADLSWLAGGHDRRRGVSAVEVADARIGDNSDQHSRRVSVERIARLSRANAQPRLSLVKRRRTSPGGRGKAATHRLARDGTNSRPPRPILRGCTAWGSSRFPPPSPNVRAPSVR
jgi:hypothetical protein